MKDKKQLHDPEHEIITDVLFERQGCRLGSQTKVLIRSKENPAYMALFEYYDDELTFNQPDFVGLTVKQALALRHKRDVEYLQS